MGSGSVTPTPGRLLDPPQRLGPPIERLKGEVRHQFDHRVGIVVVEPALHNGAYIRPQRVELLDPRGLVSTVQALSDLYDARSHVTGEGDVDRVTLARLSKLTPREFAGQFEQPETVTVVLQQRLVDERPNEGLDVD
jgi:hypothetical protein